MTKSQKQLLTKVERNFKESQVRMKKVPGTRTEGRAPSAAKNEENAFE